MSNVFRGAILIGLMAFVSHSLCANHPLTELTISKIDDNVYLHVSYHNTERFGLVSSNGLVLKSGQDAYIIDTPWSEDDTIKLVGWIGGEGLRLKGSLSTHSHDDRTAGIKWLNSQSVPTYASTLTNEQLEKKGKALATMTFENPKTVLVDKVIEVFYPGGGHTIDNVVVWLPQSKILFGGCFVRSSHSKTLGNTNEAVIKDWPTSVDKVLALYSDAIKVIPGHGKMGDKQLLEHTKALAFLAKEKEK